MTHRPIIGVMGSGNNVHCERARALGLWLAKAGFHLLTGGGGGVMQTVSKAFCDVSNRKGLVIGVVPCTESDPTCRPQPGYPNESVEIRIFTHLFLTGNRGTESMSRNHINVLSSDVIIALPGGPGTAGEVQLALRYGRPIVVYASNRDEIPALRQEITVETDFGRLQDFVRACIANKHD